MSDNKEENKMSDNKEVLFRYLIKKLIEQNLLRNDDSIENLVDAYYINGADSFFNMIEKKPGVFSVHSGLYHQIQGVYEVNGVKVIKCSPEATIKDVNMNDPKGEDR